MCVRIQIHDMIIAMTVHFIENCWENTNIFMNHFCQQQWQKKKHSQRWHRQYIVFFFSSDHESLEKIIVLNLFAIAFTCKKTSCTNKNSCPHRILYTCGFFPTDIDSRTQSQFCNHISLACVLVSVRHSEDICKVKIKRMTENIEINRIIPC